MSATPAISVALRQQPPGSQLRAEALALGLPSQRLRITGERC